MATFGGFGNAEQLKFILSLDGVSKFMADARQVGDTGQRELKKVDSSLDDVGKRSGLTGQQVAGFAASAGLAITAFATDAVRDFQRNAQAVLDFSTATGQSAEESSRWVAVADDFEVSSDAMGTALNKLGRTAETTPTKLESLGLQIQRTGDGAVDVQGTFLALADKISGLEDPAQRAALGQAALGRQWQSLSRLLVAGSGDITQALSEVEDAQIFSDEDLEKSEDFRLSMDALQEAGEALGRDLAERLIPALVDLANIAIRVKDVFDGGLGILDAVGSAYGDITSGLHDLIPGMGQFKEIQEASLDSTSSSTAAIESQIDALGEEAAAVDEAAEALKRKEEALDRARERQEALNTATLASIDSNLAHRNAVDQAEEAVRKLTEAQESGTATAEELDDITRDVEGSLLGAAAAAVKEAEDIAIAAGRTFDANAKTAAYRDELEKLKAKFPQLAPIIDGYIRQLDAIPNRVQTDVVANFITTGNPASSVSSGVQRLHSGGVVQGPPGSEVPALLEPGEIVINPDAPGGDVVSRNGGDSGRGGVVNVYVQAPFGSDPQEWSRKVGEGLVLYLKNHGPGALRQLLGI